ncbi:MAG: hypothetical protein LBG99_09070 [Propionibacteriaceae bacterium]|nr:hypothetical protein [Propionibacteriaceae bacterium]
MARGDHSDSAAIVVARLVGLPQSMGAAYEETWVDAWNLPGMTEIGFLDSTCLMVLDRRMGTF